MYNLFPAFCLCIYFIHISYSLMFKKIFLLFILQLYQPLNIFIALVGVEVWKDEDQVEISTDGDKTLTNFLNYRKVRLIQEHPNDNAQLLTWEMDFSYTIANMYIFLFRQVIYRDILIKYVPKVFCNVIDVLIKW